jgi:hypothetical protein
MKTSMGEEWNNIDTETSKYEEKIRSRATLFTTNLTWTELGSNSGHRGDRPEPRQGNLKTQLNLC